MKRISRQEWPDNHTGMPGSVRPGGLSSRSRTTRAKKNTIEASGLLPELKGKSEPGHNSSLTSEKWLYKASGTANFRAPVCIRARGQPNHFSVMKVLSSLSSAKRRHADCQIVKRKGTVYVICKSNPKFKARQGATAGTRLSKKGL